MWRRLGFVGVYGWPFFLGLLVAPIANSGRTASAIIATGVVTWFAWAVWFVGSGTSTRLKAHWRLPLLIWHQPDMDTLPTWHDGPPAGVRGGTLPTARRDAIVTR